MITGKTLAILKGRLSRISSERELREVLLCLSVVLDFSPEDVIRKVQDVSTGSIHSICVSTIAYGGDTILTIVLGSKEYPVPQDLATEEGVFSYTYNISMPYLSEGGDSFFERRGDGYHRIA